MRNERIQVILPDNTKLIAEAETNTDYSNISISYEDADGNIDEVAFAEYNQDKCFGEKVQVGAYSNADDDTKYYGAFCKCIKPSFKELYELYSDDVGKKLICRKQNDFLEIVREKDDAVIYRDFICDNVAAEVHIGHKLELAAYTSKSGIRNIAIECMDCCEVIYSVENPLMYEKLFQMCTLTKDESEKLCYTNSGFFKECCVGYLRIDFGHNGSEFWTTWFDVCEKLKSDDFKQELDSLINDYLRYNVLACLDSMKSFAAECTKLLKISEDSYAVRYCTKEFTYVLRIIPIKDNYNAYLYAYKNELLYQNIEPPKLPFELDMGCTGVIEYVKHTEKYKSPGITYLDYAEDECWRLFKEYASFVGVEFEDGIDFSIAKEISEKIISVVEKTFGVEFPINKNGG